MSVPRGTGYIVEQVGDAYAYGWAYDEMGLPLTRLLLTIFEWETELRIAAERGFQDRTIAYRPMTEAGEG